MVTSAGKSGYCNHVKGSVEIDEVDDELLDDDGVIERRSHPLSYMTKSVANLCTGRIKLFFTFDK